jgi:hypothetical protein
MRPSASVARSLADRARAVAEDRDAAAAHLVAVADRAVAQQPLLDRRLGVAERRRDVLDAGGEEHGPGGEAAAVDDSRECLAAALQPLDTAGAETGAVALGLAPHVAQQRLALDPVGIARVIVAARDERGAARAGVDKKEAPAVAREVDRSGEPGGAAADHQRIERVGHARQTAAGRRRSKCGGLVAKICQERQRACPNR